MSVSHLKLKQTKSPTIKSMTQSLPTRSNQDEFSKSNTTPQSGGSAVVHDKNTKRHLKNKVNQRLTSTNNKYFSHFTQTEELCAKSTW